MNAHNPIVPFLPTSRALMVAAAVVTGGPVLAQSADAVRGRLLFEQTPQATASLACRANAFFHAALDPVADRRSAIAGGAFGAITQAQARTSRVTGGLSQPEMAPFKTALSPQDLDDLAAYIADTPRTSVTALELAAPAVR